MLIDLTPYRVQGRQALYAGIPMSLFTPELKALLRAQVKATTGMRTQFKFRGPRNTVYDWAMNRSKYTRQSSCIKAAAKTFSVYAWQPWSDR